MTVTFRLQPGEFDRSFFEKLTSLISDREVELIVYEPDSGKSDYPYDNPAQAKFLREALDRVDRSEGLVRVTLDELRKQHS